MTAKRNEHESLADTILCPFAGWLLGPGAWAAHDELSDTLASWAGQAGLDWTLHLITLMLLAVAAAGGLVSWRSYNRLGVRTEDRHRRRGTVALIGSVVAALSFLGILMEAAGHDLEFVYRYGAGTPAPPTQHTVSAYGGRYWDRTNYPTMSKKNSPAFTDLPPHRLSHCFQGLRLS